MGTSGSGKRYNGLQATLVGADEHQVEVFRKTAATIGICDVATYGGAKPALAKMRHSGAPDILFAWFPKHESDSLQLCRFVRNRDTFPQPFLPIVAIMEVATIGSVTEVRDVGVDEFLACPFSPKAFMLRIQSILNDRRGFVDVPGYFGPDRRRGAMAKWLGSDRRSGPSRLIDPVTEQHYIA